MVDNPALAPGDTVVLAGGDYDVPAAISVSKRISVEGATSGAPTRLFNSSPIDPAPFQYSASGNQPAHITDIEGKTDATTFGRGLQFTNYSATTELVVERVRGEASGDYSNGLDLSQRESGSRIVLRDSVARDTGTNGTAVNAAGPGTGTGSVELRNVTADARGGGTSATGLAVYSGSGFIPPSTTTCGTVVATIKNTYVRAVDPSRDVSVFGQASYCGATLKSVNSNWRGPAAAGLYGTVSSTDDQHSADALFANTAAGDYHQLAGSPTIDAGTLDGLIGPLDIDHAARVQYAAVDIGADEYTIPSVQTADTVAPSGSGLSLSPSSFVPGGGPASASKKKRARPKGTTISYQLSEASTVVFTVQRKVKGRKGGKKCSTTRKKGKRCTTFKAVKGSFTRAGTAGANKFHFTGYLNSKKLKRGSYRLSGAPADAAGNKGAVFTSSFKIVRR